MRRSPTTPGQSSHPTLISGPTFDLVCTCSKISPRRTLETSAAYRLYPRSTSAKNPHHSRQLSLTFDSSCMGPKSSPIPLDKYHSQDLVHGIGEKPARLECPTRPVRNAPHRTGCPDGLQPVRFPEIPRSARPYESCKNI